MVDCTNTENVHYEGKDSVGKGDAARSTVAALLFSEEIFHKGKRYDSKDVCVIQTDFPQYWGLGALIRKMNSNDGRRHFEEMRCPSTEILHLRKAMYAMDRLLTLLLLSRMPKDPNKLYIHVSDRGPYSQTVTHAICFDNEDDYLQSLDSVVDSDKCYINRVEPNTVLLEASVSGLGGTGGRDRLDDLEMPKYQKLAELGFDHLKTHSENRITSVITRIGNDWRDRGAITAEALQTIGVECPSMPRFEEVRPKDFAKAIQEGRLIQIGATEFIDFLYPDLTEDQYKHLQTIHDLDLWRKVNYFSWDSDPAPIVAHASIGRKAVMLSHEEVNSKKIGWLLQDRPIPKHKVPKDIESFGRYLIDGYTGGQLLDLIRFLDAPRIGTFSDDRGESGYELLLKKLFVPEIEY